MDTNELFSQRETASQTLKRNLWLPRKKLGGREKLVGSD